VLGVRFQVLDVRFQVLRFGVKSRGHGHWKQQKRPAAQLSCLAPETQHLTPGT
jgi:hypothetical protein